MKAGAAALGTARPGSGMYIHGLADREVMAERVLDATGFWELQRLSARVWTENILLREQVERLEAPAVPQISDALELARYHALSIKDQTARASVLRRVDNLRAFVDYLAEEKIGE